MEEALNILIPYGYEPPTEADVRTGKNYVLRREQNARGLSSLIDALLKDSAEEITRLCYQYNVDPKDFLISSKYDEKLFEQIAQILDNLEDEILDIVLEYSMRCTESENRKSALLPWILMLGRGNRNLRQTLEKRLLSFSRDLEAMIVAVRLAKYDMAKAITRIKSNLHAVYVMPEMLAAFKQASKLKATYIKTKGVKHGNVGSSNSEANNIERFAKTTLQMAWMRNQRLNYEEKGAEGYAVLRGSSYPCDLCDSKVGWHPITDTESFPPQHPSCVCYTVPIFKTE
jgi:hypothetical protein